MEAFLSLSPVVAVTLLLNRASERIVIRSITIALAFSLPAWLQAGETGPAHGATKGIMDPFIGASSGRNCPCVRRAWPNHRSICCMPT